MNKEEYQHFTKEMDFRQLEDDRLIGLASWDKEKITEDQFKMVTKILQTRGHDVSEFEQSSPLSNKVNGPGLIGPILLFFLGIFRYFNSSSGSGIVYLVLAAGWLCVILYSATNKE